MDELDMWDEFTVKAINDEWTLRYYTLLMNLLNSQVDEAVKWLDTEEAQEYYYDEAQYQYQLFKALEEQWDETLKNKYPSIEALLQEVYNRGKAKGYADMREHIRYTDTDKLALEFVTNYNFALIRRLDDDTREQIKNNITSAVLSGENPRSIAPKIMDTIGTRLEGSTFTPMQRAVMIARTEISRVQNTGILQSYVNEGYTEVKILTAEDNNVCYTCLSYAYEFNNDNFIYSNRGEEKVHNIIELLKGGLFPPFHPNCRCTYLSIWETKIDKNESSDDDIIINCSQEIDSSKKPSNKHANSDKKFNHLKSNEDVAEYFGFYYWIENGNYVFYDDKNFTKIVVDKFFIFGEGSKHIDFTNSGNGKYDIKEILKFYDEAPLTLKLSVNNISFLRKGKKDITLGSSYIDGSIKIFERSILKNRNLRGNVAQTMYHEMGHCLEYKLVKEEIIKPPERYSMDEIWKAYHSLSEHKDFEDACNNDKNYHSSRYSKNKGLKSENFAEAISIAAFENISDKSMAVLTDMDGNPLPYEKWIIKNTNKFIYACKKIRDGI